MSVDSRFRVDRRDAGVALLEALIAVTILTAFGVAVTAVATQALHATRSAAEADTRILAADRALRAISLWPATDLDRRLGTRRQGPWWVSIQRIAPDLYSVTIRDREDAPPLLETILRRPGDS